MTPSTTINGEVLPVMADLPLTCRFPPPLAFGLEVTVNPGTLPLNTSCTLWGFSFSSCVALTCDTAPVTSLFCRVPYPTTTTSFKAFTASTNVTLNCVFVPTLSSWLVKPVELIINMPFEGTLGSTKRPSGSVVVPFVVPFTVTLTPCKGVFLLSYIEPVILWEVCALSTTGRQKQSSNKNRMRGKTPPCFTRKFNGFIGK